MEPFVCPNAAAAINFMIFDRHWSLAKASRVMLLARYAWKNREPVLPLQNKEPRRVWDAAAGKVVTR